MTEEGVKTLLTWKAMSRTFKQHDKEFYSTMIALAILFSIVFFFIKEFLLIIVIWAAVFFTYAVSQVPPEELEHKITTDGITVFGKSYLWDDLGPFWFIQKDGETMVKIASKNTSIFGEIALLLGNVPQEKMKAILANYLPYMEVPDKTFSDKAADWLSTRFSFEKAIRKD